MARSMLVIPPLCLVFGCGIENEVGGEGPYYPPSGMRPVEDTTQVDEIVQVTTPLVDILWTIDNSSSMGGEQQELTSNFDSFMSYFLDSGLDYHIGVTSTDLDNNTNGSKGKLRVVQGLKYIDPDTLDPLNVFTQMAAMGTGGSGTEKGLGATYQALETNRETTNAGFYRDDAAIHTIVISDEPDMTPDNVISQPEFVGWYESLKTDPEDRTFSSIVGPQGSRYENSSIDIGGIVWDITSDDWPQLLERLGIQAAGLDREYFLSNLPVPGTLDVAVLDSESGARIEFLEATGIPPAGEEDRYYLYESNRNSIVFLSYVPNPLSTVVLTYTLLASQQSQTEILD